MSLNFKREGIKMITFSLLKMLGQNENLYVAYILLLLCFSFETMIPPDASGMLGSLLDLITSLSHLLSKAGHTLEYLPEFLHSLQITSLLDKSNFQQVCV